MEKNPQEIVEYVSVVFQEKMVLAMVPTAAVVLRSPSLNPL